MVENKKFLLKKVNTLKNINGSLKKFVRAEKFTWSKEAMGFVALVQ
jgi:hypothetical protein